MKKIASFTIDHIKLQPGIYVSRKDYLGDQVITTFDIRMTSPNEEPVMNTAELHTIEHLGATFLRNHPTFADKTVYFGPMGCRTGFYLLLAGDYESKDIVPLVTEMFTFIRDFHDEVPGASPKDCGNYLDMNLSMANYLAKKYLDEVLTDIKADRLISILDWNGVQLDGTTEQIMPMGDIELKFKAFGYNTIVCDGHNVAALSAAIETAKSVKGVPSIILAKTVKGKGISFMEGKNTWHGAPVKDADYEAAMKELGGVQ